MTDTTEINCITEKNNLTVLSISFICSDLGFTHIEQRVSVGSGSGEDQIEAAGRVGDWLAPGSRAGGFP